MYQAVKMNEFSLIHVGIADMKVSSGENILRTVLGSCVGLCLYDHQKAIGGLSHIMLPSANIPNPPPEKYADTALPLLLKKMQDSGADPKRMQAKIAGGAKMFNLPNGSTIATIGMNNINKVEQLLKEMHITLLSKDVGGNYSRIVSFHLSSGEVKIKANGMPDVIL
jgi:chemotaxis protein CheD